MDEEPTLPPLAAWGPMADTFSNHPPNKRVRLSESSPPLSSDPIFSSDEDPSADNYVQGRRKKQFRGPWYRQEPEEDSEKENTRISHKKTRTLTRQLDSGVWMGSDGTDLELEDLPVSPPSQSYAFRSSQRVVEVPWEDGVVAECLEYGSENVDLSSHNLRSISAVTIRPLHAFVLHANTDGTSFIPLVPELRLFLYQNCLESIPGEIFKLEHLSLLSLRDNVLKELPSNIGQATNLSDLNISSNKLRYLPYEILELFKSSSHLTNLHIHPNPFYEPEGLADTANPTPRYTGSSLPHRTSETLQDPNSAPHWKTTYRCSTPIRYFDTNGTLIKGPTLPGESDEAAVEPPVFPSAIEPFQYPSLLGGSRPVVQLNTPPRCRSPTGNRLPLRTTQQQPPPPRGSHNSLSPSLLETVLRTCYKSPELPSLPEALSYEHPDYPEHLSNLLTYTKEVKEAGGHKCTICGRGFIVKRTEWIEWWEIKKEDGKPLQNVASPLGMIENYRDVVESLVPLVRRGCSWGCVSEDRL